MYAYSAVGKENFETLNALYNPNQSKSFKVTFPKNQHTLIYDRYLNYLDSCGYRIKENLAHKCWEIFK